MRPSAHLATLALVLSACHQPAADTTPPAPPPIEPTIHHSADPPIPTSAPAPPSLERTTSSISLRRTRCHGHCPAYEVTLFSNGRVDWVGHDFVARIGPAIGRADPAAVAELFRALERIDFTVLPSKPVHEPRGCATDHPTAMVTVAQEGSSERRAVDNYGCSEPELEKLRPIEQRIDEVAGSAAWIAPPCTATSQAVYFLERDVDPIAGDEPADQWRRKVMADALAALKADASQHVRIRSRTDAQGLAGERVARLRRAFEHQGIAGKRVVTWLLEGPEAADPAGWAAGEVVIEIGGATCLEIQNDR